MPRSPATRLRKILRYAKGRRATDRVYPPDQIGTGGRKQAIPLMVYQTAESRGVHPLHAKSIEQFRQLNPDISFVLFDRADRDEYMQERWSDHPILDVYQRALVGQMQADIFRYCIVFDRGGYYFDYNKGCSVPLHTLHPADSEGLVTAESNLSLVFPKKGAAQELSHPTHLYAQWGFGFRAKHPLLHIAIERIVEIEPFFRDKEFSVPKEAVLTMTATGLFTDSLRTYVSKNGAEGLTQAGIDFFGNGIFRLQGSKIALRAASHYSKQRDQAVVTSPQ